MIKIAALLATAALTAGTASAAPNAELPAAKSDTARYAVSYDRKHDRYCLRDRTALPATGSRLVPTQCKSSADWAAEGLTIGRKN